MEYVYVGRVSQVFSRINVAAIVLEDELYLHDWVLFEGPHTELEQQVTSMQINRENIDKALAGEEVGIKVDGRVRPGDEVYLIVDEPVE